jgi:hypothetical protein
MDGARGIVYHPSRNCKDATRMGHPQFSTCLHCCVPPIPQEARNGWGTGYPAYCLHISKSRYAPEHIESDA